MINVVAVGADHIVSGGQRRPLAALASELFDALYSPGDLTVAVVTGREPEPIAQLRERLDGHGYRVGEPGPSGWAVAYRDGHAVHIYRTAAADPDSRCDLLGSIGSGQPWDAVARLTWWREHTLTDYHGTPGLSALDALRRSLARADGRGPAVRVDRPEIAGQAPVQAVSELVWRRRRAKERTGYRWDMRAAYLAAASSAELGWGAPRQTGPDPEQGAAGWYRIVCPEGGYVVGGVPVIDPDRIGRRDRTAWVAEPVVSFLREVGRPVEVVDSWTSPTRGRLLRTWAEQWRDVLARVHTRHGGRPLVKAAYVQAIGLLGRPGGLIYRPDWHDTIRAQARASMLRRIRRVADNTGGVTPVSVNIDAVYYDLKLSRDTAREIDQYIGTGNLMGNMAYEGKIVDGKRWAS
jgi:hypothetical protein